MTASNPHFESAASWEEAADLVDFEPWIPTDTLGAELTSLAVFVMNNKQRRLPKRERSLEAFYDGFVIDQKRHESVAAARAAALDVPCGLGPEPVLINGHEGRFCKLGPEVESDDIDGRSPATVVWHVGEVVRLLASTQLDHDELLRIARSG